MTDPAHNGAAPEIYHLRHFKCFNWHNLATQDGPLRGNIFNLGDVGTGKTTWMEGLQAAIVLGEPRMRWNSAASQGVSISEQEDGRDLLTIVLRYQQMAKQYKRTMGVSYFALELTDESGGHPLTIGIGASAASPQSRVNKWGFITRKPIKDVQFVDDRNKLLDHAAFEDANGRGNIFGVGEYILHLGTLLYGSQENFEHVMRLWNLSKSYIEIARQSRDYTELFRRILQPPNETDYQQALQHLANIRRLSQEIKDREATRDRLLDLQKHLNIIRREAGSLVRYDYFERILRHRQLEGERKKLESTIDTNRRALAESQEASRLHSQRRMTENSRIRDLEATGASQLMERRRGLGELIETLEGRVSQQKSLVEQRRGRHAEADHAALQQWKRFDTARNEATRSLEQTLQRHSSMPADLTTPIHQSLDAMKTIGPEDATLPASVALNQDEFNRALHTLGIKADRAAQTALATVNELDAQLSEVHRETDTLKRNAEIQPIAGLDEALSEIRSDVSPLYRLLAPRDGAIAEVGLLESFLPPNVLAAVLPKRPADTQRIRDHLGRVRPTPGLRIVDAETLARTPAPELIAGSILDCLDRAACDPVAYAYVAHEFGDVALLEAGAERAQRSRVLWRNGDVYDGHAYRLETVKAAPEYIGPESRKAAVEKRLGQLAKQRRNLEERRATHDAAATAARRMLQSLDQLSGEVADTFQAANLPRVLSEATLARAHAAEEERALKETVEAHRRESKELAENQSRLEDLDARIRQSGADESMRALDAARKRLREAEDALHKAEIDAGVYDKDIHRDTEALKMAQESERLADTHARELIPRLRQLASEESPPIASVDDYLRAKGFKELTVDRLERNRQDAHRTQDKAKLDLLVLNDKVRPELPLEYREDLNMLLEPGTGKTLSEHLERFNVILKEEYKRQTELYTAFNTRIIVDNMARQLRRDQTVLRKRIDELNRVLAEAPIGRRSYQIRVTNDNDNHDVGQMRKYVEESREEAKMDALASFIRSHLEKGDPAGVGVPQIFDYRHWYKFSIQARAAGGGPDVELRRAVGSGGEQAIPNYLICFALFHILYERIHAKLRLVLLDEAFDKISAKEINQLLQTANRLHLTLIATSNKLEPVPVDEGTFTTQIFRVNEDEDSIIERFSREATAVVP